MNSAEFTAKPVQSVRYRFGEWSLDPLSGDLGRADQRLRLQEQPLRILVMLLDRPGEMVSREELIRAVWPQGVVEFDMGLNTAVRKLRVALGDDAGTPRFIETIPRRGYRFIAPVTREAAQAPQPTTPHPSASPVPGPSPASAVPGGKRLRLVAALVALVAVLAAGLAWLNRPGPETSAAVRSMAVLPFQPMTNTPEDAAWGMGLTGTLITRLSSLPQLRVTPLGAVRQLDERLDPTRVGAELGVEAVMEGMVQQQGDRLRVSLRLLRVSDGHSLLAEQFDVVKEDLFQTQDAIASRVAAAVNPARAASTRVSWPRETQSMEAFRLFASAQYNQFRRDINGIPTAVREYEAALAADPNYVDAWAGLSVALAVQAVFGMEPPPAVWPRARQAAERALALDGSSALARGVMGHVLVQGERRYAEGMPLYRQALADDPNLAIVHQWLAIATAHQGNMEEALRGIRAASALEPKTLAFNSNIGLLLFHARRYDEAAAHSRELLRLEPRFDQARSVLANALLARGDSAQALEVIRGKNTPGPGGLGDLARAYAVAADPRFDAEAERLAALGRQGFGVEYDLATAHALRGDHARACQSLQNALTDQSQMLGFMRVDPRLDSIRGQDCYARVERALYGSVAARP